MPTWMVFIGVLSILVLVHEAGHFLAARWLGIKVEEFAFGLPFTKPILKLKRGETQYAVYPLLFGGFVRLYGEEEEIVEKDRKRSFWARGRKQRMLVVGAGVVMNVILAMVGFVVLYGVVGTPVNQTQKVTIVEVDPGSPAEAAGLKVEDRVVEVEGKAVGESADEFGQLMRSWGGVGVNLTVERGESVPLFEGLAQQGTEREVVYVVPRLNPPEGEGPLGVAVSSWPYLETRKCSVVSIRCAGGAVVAGVEATGEWMARVVQGLRAIGKSLVAGRVPEGVAGPVGIYQLTDIVAKGGWLPLLELTAILSVNLAVFNVLPVPALDGGRMLFIWIEWVRKKRLPPELEQRVNWWGMVVLLTLLALITLQDLLRVGTGGGG